MSMSRKIESKNLCCLTRLSSATIFTISAVKLLRRAQKFSKNSSLSQTSTLLSLVALHVHSHGFSPREIALRRLEETFSALSESFLHRGNLPRSAISRSQVALHAHTHKFSMEEDLFVVLKNISLHSHIIHKHLFVISTDDA